MWQGARWLGRCDLCYHVLLKELKKSMPYHCLGKQSLVPLAHYRRYKITILKGAYPLTRRSLAKSVYSLVALNTLENRYILNGFYHDILGLVHSL